MITQNYSGDQLATIANFRTRAGELANLLETIPDEEHDQETWAVLSSDDNGHFCKTPQCALGWAVHRGLIPDARLAILAYSGSLEDNDPSKFTWFADAADGPDDLTMFEIPEKFDPAGHVDVFPVRNGMYFDWGQLGEEHYGQVVTHGVFYDSDLTKAEVIKLLREYAVTGRVSRASGYTYYHHAENLALAACETAL